MNEGVDFVLACKFLQYHAVELSHARKPEDKYGEVAVVMERGLTIVALAGFIEIRERQIGDAFAVFFGSFFEYLRQERFAAVAGME